MTPPPFPGLKETTNILSAMGGEYKELIVDISKKEEVYKAADHIRETMGDVSIANKYSDSEGVRRND